MNNRSFSLLLSLSFNGSICSFCKISLSLVSRSPSNLRLIWEVTNSYNCIIGLLDNLEALLINSLNTGEYTKRKAISPFFFIYY